MIQKQTTQHNQRKQDITILLCALGVFCGSFLLFALALVCCGVSLFGFLCFLCCYELKTNVNNS